MKFNFYFCDACGKELIFEAYCPTNFDGVNYDLCQDCLNTIKKAITDATIKTLRFLQGTNEKPENLKTLERFIECTS